MNHTGPAPELAVIGSCLADEGALATAAAHLKPEHFTDGRFAVIFTTLLLLKSEGIPADVVIVNENIPPENRETVSLTFLLDVAQAVPTALHVEHYIALMKRTAARKEIVAAYKKAMSDPLNAERRDEIRALWDAYLAGRSRTRNLGNDLHEYMKALEDRAKTGKTVGYLSGFAALDRATRGARPGQLWTIGARTSFGKTTYLLNLTDRWIHAGLKVLFMSAEMGYEELIDRLVASRTKLSLEAIEEGRGHLGKIHKAVSELHGRPLVVDDTALLTMDTVRAAVEANKPAIVVVDYIQRFRVPPKTNNRAAFFSDVANDLKTLAREKGIVVIASSQILRAVVKDGRQREPTLADLKESGGIEEASDKVMLLHSGKKDDHGATRSYTFILAKQRNGPLARLNYVFLKASVSFEEASNEPEPYSPPPDVEEEPLPLTGADRAAGNQS